MEIILCLLSGGVAAAVVKIIDNVIMYKLKSKDHKSQEALAEKKLAARQQYMDIEKLHNEMQAISQGMKYVLYDRIKYLGTRYLEDGSISFDDRRIVHDMHSVYHNNLGGNGDLDSLMREIYKLPLKKR